MPWSVMFVYIAADFSHRSMEGNEGASHFFVRPGGAMLDSKGRKVPTLRAQWLGRELRDLRERRNLTLRQSPST